MSKILIVDDSVTIRHLLKTVLVGDGYEVTEAASGSAGLSLARESAFAAIICDINMPGMDGLAMISELRVLPNHATTPIFVLTTETSLDIRERGKQAGATAWMPKPLRPDTLLGALKNQLRT